MAIFSLVGVLISESRSWNEILAFYVVILGFITSAAATTGRKKRRRKEGGDEGRSTKGFFGGHGGARAREAEIRGAVGVSESSAVRATA